MVMIVVMGMGMMMVMIAVVIDCVCFTLQKPQQTLAHTRKGVVSHNNKFLGR